MKEMIPEVFDQAIPLFGQYLLHQDKKVLNEAIQRALEPRAKVEEIELWVDSIDAMLPLEKHDYQTSEPPSFSRNDPCPCGSGKKVKRCCTYLLEKPVMAVSDQFYALALDSLSFEERIRLAEQSPLPRPLLRVFVEIAHEHGDFLAILTACEESITDFKQWRNEDVDLFSSLMEAYLQLGMDEERFDAAQQAIKDTKANKIQSSGYQRLAMMAAERDDEKTARDYLHQAMKLAPNHEELPMSELSILGVIGEEDELKMRARYWQKKLLKHYEPDAPMFDWIDDILRDGKAVFARMLDLPEEPLADPQIVARVTTLFQNNEFQLPYSIRVKDQKGSCSLKPGLRKTLERWQAAWEDNEHLTCELFEVITEDDIDSWRWQCPNIDWLEILEEFPVLLDIFEVQELLEGFVACGPDDDVPMDEPAPLWSAFEARRLHSVKSLVGKGIAEKAVLPEHFKANMAFWSAAEDTLINLNAYTQSDEIVQDLVLSLYEVALKSGSWLNDYRLKYLLKKGDYAGYVEHFKKCRSVSLGSYLCNAAALAKTEGPYEALSFLKTALQKHRHLIDQFKHRLETNHISQLLGPELDSWPGFLDEIDYDDDSVKQWLLRNLP